jgi:hypothetical protein
MSILVYLGQEQFYTSGTKTAYPSGAPDFTPPNNLYEKSTQSRLGSKVLVFKKWRDVLES